MCVCTCVWEREKVCRPQQSAVAAACPPSFFFFPPGLGAASGSADSVFSAVQFQRKAAKQNGTGLSQILSCRWTDRRKHAGTASLWCLYTCSIYRRAGNRQRGGRNRQQVQSLTKAAFKPIILNESCSFRGKPELICAWLLLALTLELTGAATLELVSIETTQRPFSTSSHSPCSLAAAC